MITCVGEILVDKLVKEDGSVCHIGGAPFNVAVGAVRCGSEVRFVGKVGADDPGAFLLAEAARFGVEACISVDEAHPTTVALVTLRGGERSFRFVRSGTADYMLTEPDIRIAPHTTIVHLGTLMLSKPEGRVAADIVVRMARQHGALLSVDANFRDDLFATPAIRNEVMTPYLRAADILKMSAEEICDLTGKDDLDEAVAAFAYGGMMFVTAGSAPSRAYMGGHYVEAMPPHLDKVVDTTGAGDAFYGAILAQLDQTYAKGLQPTLPVLQAFLTVANRCGAEATQREGAV